MVIACIHSGRHVPVKTLDPSKQRNSRSGRINCPFHINVRSPDWVAPAWYISTIVSEHNHPLKAPILASRRKTRMTHEMHAKVQNIGGRISVDDFLNVLHDAFPERELDRRKVANAIQKARRLKGALLENSESAQLISILNGKKESDPEWFFKVDRDQENRLRRVFWMNPTQRLQYYRYRDVVVNDNTSNTNRFGMYFNAMVVVDADGRSCLVACSLIRSESIEDYSWILQSLLEASSGRAPGVLIVDGDVAMEVACRETLPDTVALGCLWHIYSQNLPRNLRSSLNQSWDAFMAAFWSTRNSITEQEFEHRWNNDLLIFGEGKPKVEEYLANLYKRRERWAWPWVGTKFTAGMQSTQRVESMHGIIKKKVNSQTRLQVLFESIEDKLSSTGETQKYLHSKEDIMGLSDTAHFSQRMFPSVIKENDELLGGAARNQMRREMMQSVYYMSALHGTVEEEAKRTRCDYAERLKIGKVGFSTCE